MMEPIGLHYPVHHFCIILRRMDTSSKYQAHYNSIPRKTFDLKWSTSHIHA